MHIDDALIDHLLHEDEGDALDFKRDQYRFVLATDADKSELLKDVLAFANAWRRTDAFILIGVEQVKGGRSIIIGLAEDDLDDAALQQFVNSKTNRPIQFSYRVRTFEGRRIGIVHVPLQQRPLFLNRRFGPLAAHTVYLRRGSSTDIARPDEVARMGDPFSSPRPTPDLEVFFADPESRSALPPNIEIETVAWTMRDDEVIPDCQPARSPSQPFGVAFPAGLLTCHNRDFYRELAEYIMAEGLFRPIYIGVRNRGDDSARDVRLELQVDRADGIVRLIGASEYPRLPRRTRDRLDLAGRIPDVSMTDLTLTGLKERWLIEGSTQIVHAKQVFWFEEGIFIGATQSTAIRIGVIAYAEGIREPHEQQFLINAKVTQRVLRSEDVLKIAKEA